MPLYNYDLSGAHLSMGSMGMAMGGGHMTYYSTPMMSSSSAMSSSLPLLSSSLPPLSTSLSSPLAVSGTVSGSVTSSSVTGSVDMSTYNIQLAEQALGQQAEHCVQLAEQKEKLTAACYENVDGYIRRLDAQLRKMETQLRKGQFEVPPGPIDRRTVGIKTTMRSWEFDPDDRALHLQLQNELREEIEKQSVQPVAGSLPPLPDPAEPVYCLCQKVSYGEMVACDNPECKIEWFHFQCVGLDATPRGKWYCDECKSGQKKKQKKRL